MTIGSMGMFGCSYGIEGMSVGECGFISHFGPDKRMGNVSICRHDDELIASVRVYGKRGEGFFGPHRGNILIRLNEELGFSGEIPMSFYGGFDVAKSEDIRLVSWEGDLWCSGTYLPGKKNEIIEIRMCKSDKGERTGFSFTPIYNSSSDNLGTQKNWMPVEDIPGLYVVRIGNGRIDFYDAKSKRHFSRESKGASAIRGTSNVMRVGAYRIALCHQRNSYSAAFVGSGALSCRKVYSYRFVLFDDSWNVVSMSRRFKLSTAEIEFTCCMFMAGEDVVIPVTEFDDTTRICRAPLKSVFKMLNM